MTAKSLTVKQVADRLQVTEETVRSYLIAGKLKGTKIAGWIWRIKEDDFEEFTKAEGGE